MRRPTPRIPDESWRPERSLSITDALEALLDDLELLYRHADDESPADPLPLSTGLYGLDDVLRGGIRIGAVTLLEADVRAQADALLFSIARRIARPALLNSASLLDATRWLVAGAAGVPAVCVATGHLTEHDWIAIAHAVGALAHKRLSISTASTLNGLAHVVRQQPGDVLLVHDLERLGPPATTVASLERLAASQSVAIVGSTSVLGDLPSWAIERTTRVAVSSYSLGGKAALTRPDDLDMLAVAHVDIECLTGVVS